MDNSKKDKEIGCRRLIENTSTPFEPNATVPDILAEARKWNLDVVMAAQFLDQ